MTLKEKALKFATEVHVGCYLSTCSASLCREGRVGVTRDHIVCDSNRDELCACETEQQAAKIVAAFAALDYIATLKTDQLASDQQCSAVAVAMDVLSLPPVRCDDLFSNL